MFIALPLNEGESIHEWLSSSPCAFPFCFCYSRSLPFRLLIIPGDKLQNRLPSPTRISSHSHFSHKFPTQTENSVLHYSAQLTCAVSLSKGNYSLSISREVLRQGTSPPVHLVTPYVLVFGCGFLSSRLIRSGKVASKMFHSDRCYDAKTPHWTKKSRARAGRWRVRRDTSAIVSESLADATEGGYGGAFGTIRSSEASVVCCQEKIRSHRGLTRA